ncbi:hypothetical protein MAP00_003795 [Monascus purpureus]|nr:hypothetical protein MAP00_003795 [Monascus purpureus]
MNTYSRLLFPKQLRHRRFYNHHVKMVQRDISIPREDSIPHEVRTSSEPRQNRLYNARLSCIHQVNPNVRLLRLTIPQDQGDELDKQQPFTFLPGQWLDVHIPSIPQAGGFTITSTPADAQVLPSPAPPTESLSVEEEGVPPVGPRGREPYVELAVQESPSSPPAAWLWRPKEEILGKQLSIRVGGSFVWPPSGIDLGQITNIVFVAGGVGINPLISILSHLNDNDPSSTLPHQSNIHFLYSTRLSQVPTTHKTASSGTVETTLNQILFLPRLRQIAQSLSQSGRLRVSLDLFITNLSPRSTEHPVSALLESPPTDFGIHPRRMHKQDLRDAVSVSRLDRGKQSTVCYVCGPPNMTDEVVGVLNEMLGDDDDARSRILYEKWW